jgi:hypothetical protein
MVFGIAQAGGIGPPNQGLNMTTVYPGDSLTLFDGTETPALGLASIAFARGMMGSNDGGLTINLSGMPAGMAIDVQVCSAPAAGFASTTALAAAMSSVTTLTPDSGGNASYTDIGRSQFYRLEVSAYTTGAMCVGVVKR